MPHERREIWVLACHGGGFRGLAPALVLREIEARRGPAAQPLRAAFDVMIGASTGGLIAAGLGAGKTAADIVTLYEALGEEVFNRPNGIDAFIRPLGLLRPKHRLARLAAALARPEVFGDLTFADLHGDACVVSYGLEPNDTLFLHGGPSYRRRPGGNPYDAVRLADALTAGSAAPTFFEPAQFSLSRSGSTIDALAVDGGVFCNNPVMAGYVEARKLFAPAGPDGVVPSIRVNIVSLGTGRARTIGAAHMTRGWGALDWIRPFDGGAPPLIEIMMDGQARAADYQIAQLSTVRLFPFQFDYPAGAPERAMDSAAPEIVAALRRHAADMIEREAERLDDLLNALPE